MSEPAPLQVAKYFHPKHAHSVLYLGGDRYAGAASEAVHMDKMELAKGVLDAPR